MNALGPIFGELLAAALLPLAVGLLAGYAALCAALLSLVVG